MKDEQKIPRGTILAVAILAIGTVSGCSGRWFDLRPQGNTDQSATSSQGDLKNSTVTYIQGLCTLPREQRDPQLRELNEALLPNHATISCGRGGGAGRPGE